MVFLEVKPHRGYRLPLLSLMDSSRFERAGVLAYGDATIEETGWALFHLLLEVASGRRTCAEQAGLRNALVLFNPAPVT